MDKCPQTLPRCHHPENDEIERWLSHEELEDVIEEDLPIIDPHHHLWDRRDPASTFPYRTKFYEAAELAHDISRSGHNVVGTVYVQAYSFHHATGPHVWRGIGEVEFCQGVAAKCDSGCYPGLPRICWGIVGTVDLRHPDAEAVIRHMVHSRNFRGIRQLGHHEYDEDFKRGMRVLEELNLVLDRWHHPDPAVGFDVRMLPKLSGLAREFPGLCIVLDHLGGAVGPALLNDTSAFQEWQKAIDELASCPNVVAKVGGIQMKVNGFKFEERVAPIGSDELLEMTFPLYSHIIRSFGASRCMFESNFPVDRDCVSYRTLWNMFKKLATRLGLSADEKCDIFHDTAKRVYRLEEEPHSTTALRSTM